MSQYRGSACLLGLVVLVSATAGPYGKVLSAGECSGTSFRGETVAGAFGICAENQPERPGETVSVRALWDRYCDPFTRSYVGLYVHSVDIERDDGTIEQQQTIYEDAVSFNSIWDHPPENASDLQRRGEFAFMVSMGWDPTSVVRHYQVNCAGFEVNYTSGFGVDSTDTRDSGDVHFTVVDPVPVETLRARALAKIQPPAPNVGSAPPASRAVVNLPTWLWIDTPWVELSDSDGQGAVDVEVFARPAEVTWSFDDDEVRDFAGEGIEVCDDPGEAWSPADGDAESDCQYTFTYPSAWNDDEVFHGSVTVRWEVSWSLNGDDQGVFGEISRTTGFDVKVVEIQTVGVATQTD